MTVSEHHSAAENDRRMTNIIRLGLITEVDPENALARVDAGGVVTDWIPWVVSRAGGDRDWFCLEVGEQVVIAAQCGDLAQGVIIGSLFRDSRPAPSSNPDIRRTNFSDGTFVEYDRAASHLTVNVSGGIGVTVICATATVRASTSVTIDTPQTTCTGALLVQGLLTYQAGMSGSAGSGPGATITGEVVLTGGDVTADGISLKTHHHSGVQSGGAISGPPV